MQVTHVYAQPIGQPARMDFEELLAIVAASKPAWHGDAACLEHPEVSWFPERGESSAPAKAICGDCLVREECLAWAVDYEAEGAKLIGVWGGLSARERRKARAATAA